MELILNLKSSLPALVCLALSFFALLCLAWPCFALVCLALPCLALLHLAWPYFTHALSVPLLLRFDVVSATIYMVFVPLPGVYMVEGGVAQIDPRLVGKKIAAM